MFHFVSLHFFSSIICKPNSRSFKRKIITNYKNKNQDNKGSRWAGFAFLLRSLRRPYQNLGTYLANNGSSSFSIRKPEKSNLLNLLNGSFFLLILWSFEESRTKIYMNLENTRFRATMEVRKLQKLCTIITQDLVSLMILF